MIDYPDVPEPARIPGEEGWDWARRYAAAFPPEVLRRIVVAAVRARRKEIRKGFRTRPMWAYVMGPAGVGSTVAAALVERFRDERALARVEKIRAAELAERVRAISARVMARHHEAFRKLAE